jgi:tRNA (guanine9-N1)-methyltransferase
LRLSTLGTPKGLVDHNFHKGICYKKALEQGIDHGQLPISEYFWLNHRKVLTINQVFEILLRVSEGKTFKEAFEVILPKRIEKVSASKSSEDEEEMNSQSAKVATIPLGVPRVDRRKTM